MPILMLFGPAVPLRDPIAALESADVAAGLCLLGTRKMKSIAEGMSYHFLLEEVEPVLARYHW